MKKRLDNNTPKTENTARYRKGKRGRGILSNNLYQSSEIESGDMWPSLNYNQLLIISHDMKILGL